MCPDATCVQKPDAVAGIVLDWINLSFEEAYMSMIERLRRQHQMLEGEINRITRQRVQDSALLTSLKKRKLAIKDQISALMRGPRPIAAAL